VQHLFNMSLQESLGHRLRQIAALACALTYLFGGMELLPQLLALAASIEGSHTVRLTRSGEQVLIVLSHESGGPGLGPFAGVPHRHGAASRIFCVLAERTTARPDHVAAFAASALCENRGGATKVNIKSPGARSLLLAPPNQSRGNQYPTHDFSSLTLDHVRPPPDLGQLHSTVLLI
jgi:hypothetical protein